MFNINESKAPLYLKTMPAFKFLEQDSIKLNHLDMRFYYRY